MFHLTDEQIDEAALWRAVHDTARAAQDVRRRVRNDRDRSQAAEGLRRVLEGVGRGSWGGHGEDEPEPDEKGAR